MTTLEQLWELAPIDFDRTEELLASLPTDDPLDAAMAGVVRARIATGRNDTARALDALDGADERLVDAPVWRARAQHLTGMCRLFGGDLTGAIERLESSRALAESADDRAGVAAALTGIGSVRTRLGESEEALRLHAESLAIHRALGNNVGAVDALYALGVAHLSRGDYPAALERLRESIAIAETLGYRIAIARSLNVMGTVVRMMGDYAASLEYFERSLGICEEVGNRSAAAGAASNIGSINYYMGNNEAAISYWERSLAVFEETGDMRGIATALTNLGNGYKKQGDDARSRELYLRSLALREEMGDREEAALILNNIASNYRHAGDYDTALEYYRRSLDIYESIGHQAGVHETLKHIGETHIEAGRPDEALPLIERARDGAEATSNRLELVSIYDALARAFEALGEYRSANENLRKHYRLQQEMTTEAARERLQSLEATRKLELAQKEAEIERLRSVELADALEQLKSAQAQLVHAEKMASLGTLTAGIAHEINNPVNFIRASVSPLRRDVEQLLDGTLDDHDRAEVRDEVHKLLRGIEEGAGRTAEIVKGLRTFSRLDEDELKAVDLHEGIESTLALLHPRLAHMTVRRSFGELPDVDCHAGQINQVFMNLLANAIEASGERGEITIATAHDGGRVRIAITDSGTGIAPEHLDRIFDPFFTTKDVGKGTGLGLAISHSIVEKHGGAIEVESVPGAGTTVTVVLPAKQ
jgi:two-component system, NtrC family, sensor kinase